MYLQYTTPPLLHTIPPQRDTMVLISYMSVPVTTSNGETQYVKVDFVKNNVSVNNHEVESFESMAEDAEMFSSDDDLDADADGDNVLPDYMKSISRENMMQICEMEIEKLKGKSKKTETDTIQMGVLKMIMDEIHAHAHALSQFQNQHDHDHDHDHSCCGGHGHEH